MDEEEYGDHDCICGESRNSRCQATTHTLGVIVGPEDIEPPDHNDLEGTGEPLSDQTARLAQFIMDEIPGEPSQDEGAIDCAIRLLRTWKPYNHQTSVWTRFLVKLKGKMVSLRVKPSTSLSPHTIAFPTEVLLRDFDDGHLLVELLPSDIPSAQHNVPRVSIIPKYLIEGITAVREVYDGR